MTVVIIWDGTVFIRLESGAWKRGEYTRVDEAADLLRDNLPRGVQIRLIYDPESLITEIEEAPRGSRRIVGMALADRHAAITTETLVWGFQPQWAVPGRGTYATFLHTETNTGFLILRDRLERDLQAGIEGAWPLLTCAMQGRPERGRAVLTVVHDAQHGAAFVGGFQHNGDRLSVKLRQPDPLRLWQELYELLRSAGVNLGPVGGLGARITIFSTGNSEQLAQTCPFWRELQQQNDIRLETLDIFAQMVRRLPLGHPSNLLKALPGELNIDAVLKAVTALAVAVVLVVAGVYGVGLSRLSRKTQTLASEQETLGRANRRLLANKQEISNLKLLYGSDVGWISPGRAEFLRALASVIPTNATLTELSLDDGGGFQLSGYFWQTTEKEPIKALVRPLEQALVANMGTVVVASERSTFETKSGRFSISGLLNKD